MGVYDLIATATFGLESIVAREVRRLGYENVTTENARVIFQGDEEAICRCNLWLRSADRVFIRMGEFPAHSFEELFERTKALPWGDILPENANFPVQGKSVRSKLFSVPDCQAIVKKAIVEKMKLKYKRDWFEEDGPRFAIEVGLLKDIATLTIDTSGAGLHKRGYRRTAGDAPLKETLAAAMVDLSFWNPDRVLLDPMCGSGTIAIEAALIGRNMAPGLMRRFASQEWPFMPSSLWNKAREEAREAIDKSREFRILASDLDGRVLRTARYNAELAGVEDFIAFQTLPLQEISSKKKYGCMITNPPYGERLGEQREAESLYREMGEVCKKLDTWSFYVLTPHKSFESLFGRKADRKRKLYNGRIQVDYYQFYGPRPPRRTAGNTEEES
ncbi:MAG: THUMP domain-containing class I SAM-dependent RNA methyltransferase [Caldicoprobacterales bacterium]|nr:class I SAM-dependent RNA methyltransferase [Clostridiales bacterium]